MSTLKPRTIYCTGVVQKRYWVATFPGYMQKPFSFYQVFIFLNEIVHKIINPGTVFRYLPYLRTPDFWYTIT